MPSSVDAVRPEHSIAVEMSPPVPSVARVMAGMLGQYPDAYYLGPGYPARLYTSPPPSDRLARFAAIQVLRQTSGRTRGYWTDEEIAEVDRLSREGNPDFETRLASLKAVWDGYAATKGDPLVQFVIAQLLNSDFPGLDLNADRLLPVHGNSQGLSIFVELLIEKFPGKVAVLVDKRTYTGSLALFRDKGIPVYAVDFDEHGPIPSSLEDAADRARADGYSMPFYYTVPDGHNPTGVTVSLQRRQETVQVLQRKKMYCFEDNAYSFLPLENQEPLPPLAALDKEGWVVYSVTFSKVYSPASRLAMMHVPFDWKTPSGARFDVYGALTALAGFQTLFHGTVDWMALLAYLHDDRGRLQSLHDLSRERAEYYGGQYHILEEGLRYLLGNEPDVFRLVGKPQHGFFQEVVFGEKSPTSDSMNATDLMGQLLAQDKVLFMPELDFMPPSVQKADPEAQQRGRLCFSYTNKAFHANDTRHELAEAANRFGNGVRRIYGLSPKPPFHLGMVPRFARLAR